MMMITWISGQEYYDGNFNFIQIIVVKFDADEVILSHRCVYSMIT